MKELSGEILKDLISSDQKSDGKMHMQEGVDYYAGDNDILKTDFRKFYVQGSEYRDLNKSNFHLVNNFHKKLVDQKQGYIAGKPITLSAPEGMEEMTERVEDVIGRQHHDIWSEWIKGACNQGYENIHPYIRQDGSFAFAIIPALETIYITDGSIEEEVITVIRYYQIDWEHDGETQKVIRAEVWDPYFVTYWQEDEGGDFKKIKAGEYSDVPENPAPHWKEIDTKTNSVADGGWGRIPFVRLRNNAEETTDLEPIKKYVDAIDIVSSGFINDLKDVQMAIWVLRGYEGEDLSEFMLNLQHFKAIKLDADPSANAEPKTLEIPKEARKTLLDWLEGKIYQIGQGVNESDLTGANITNVVIRAHYTGLDIKANKTITKMKAALYKFLWFVVDYINTTDGTDYDAEDLEIDFNKTMIFNEKEIVEMINESSMLVSKKTLLGKHPYVEDVKAELEQLELEAKERVDNMDFPEVEE